MAAQRKRSSFSTLKRFAQRASESTQALQEHCEFCSEPIPPAHRHLVEVSSREIKCVCQACSILFDRKQASKGKYRLVPDRRLYIENFQMSDTEWENLRIPVDMAFFFFSTTANRVVVFYPSPMGPTESLLTLSAWKEMRQSNPVLNDMEQDVEALLVNRTRGARQHFLVPIDECYSLVGMIRTHWRGLSGGQNVWKQIGSFFDELAERSKIVGPAG